MELQHKYTNKLIHETSPYLLQHAHNPVNWYPWGEEALQKAKIEKKLVHKLRNLKMSSEKIFDFFPHNFSLH